MYLLCNVCILSPIVQESIESANTTIEDEDVKGRGEILSFKVFVYTVEAPTVRPAQF